jgi:hypothetical protein
MTRIYSITSAGLKPLVVKDYALGRTVRYTGDMANASGIGAIVAIRQANEYGPKSYDVALTDGRSFNRTYLDGSRWQVGEDHLNPDQVDVLRAGVSAKEASDKAKQTSAAQAFTQAVEKLRADYPHLTQGSGPVVAAKNIRAELKQAFPGVKFSARTSSYSGGNSIDISWTDGPTTKQAEAITGKYAGGSFDGMTDSYDYKSSPWTEVFGEAKYVHCNRRYSPQTVVSIARLVRSKLGGIEETPEQIAALWNNGQCYQVKQSGGCDVGREMNIQIAKRTFCL